MLNRESADNFFSVIKKELEEKIGIRIQSCIKSDESYDNVDIICCVLENLPN